MHATGGQLGVMWGREPIAEVLERPGLDAETRRKLELVLDVRAYAMQTIGLEESGSYTSYYDTGDDPVAWNVSASAVDAFAPYGWWFPVVGHLPYKGYFEVEPALADARALKAQGLDALLLPVTAYSTLGWFDDPLFSGMLDRDDAELSSTVIHEIAHATVWIDGDAEFNESLAQWVGDQGAVDYFLAKGGEDHPALQEARTSKADSRVFNEAIGELVEDLARVYESCGMRSQKIAYKHEAVQRFRERYTSELKATLSDDTYDWVLDERLELNNALLLTFRRYHGDEGLFRGLHEQLGGSLRDTVKALVRFAEEEDPRAALEAAVRNP